MGADDFMKTLPPMKVVLSGFGSAFMLFPAGQLEALPPRISTEARIARNFAMAGKRLESAMKAFEHEQRRIARTEKG